MPAHHNQEQRILSLLHAAWPTWTPATALVRISLQYNARIFSLRRKGWQICSRVEVQSNGVRHGSFRLATPRTFPNPIPLVEEKIPTDESLFGDMNAMEYPD